MKRAALATLAAVVWVGVLGATSANAQQPAQGQPPAAPRKFVVPVRGQAELGMTKPVVKVEGGEVVTTIKVKNLANGAIAGLKVDEYWYDKAGNMLPGGQFRMRQPLNPGEVATIVLRAPKDAKMSSNSYQFTHANGTIKVKQLTKIDDAK